MQNKIQKWGNSLGLRIPKALANEARVGVGSTVDITVEDGELLIRPIRSRRYDLASLVGAITPNNVHDAVETGPPRGRESW